MKHLPGGQIPPAQPYKSFVHIYMSTLVLPSQYVTLCDFVYSVPKAVMHCLVNQVKDSLQSKLVSELYKVCG